MKTLLSNTTVLLACAALFAAGLFTKSAVEADLVAPTSLSLIHEDQEASGPTIPPGPWDDEDTEEEPKIASGPTIPPGPWDDEETGEEPKIA